MGRMGSDYKQTKTGEVRPKRNTAALYGGIPTRGNVQALWWKDVDGERLLQFIDAVTRGGDAVMVKGRRGGGALRWAVYSDGTSYPQEALSADDANAALSAAIATLVGAEGDIYD